MATVASISKAAFDGVAAAISDAVLAGVLDDGATTYAGRVVFGGEKAPGGFPMASAKDKVREAYLEGFAAVAGIGDELTAGGKVYHILSSRDIVEAGGFVVANVIAATDMLWVTANFQRNTRTSDGAGGFTQAWASITGLGAVSVGMLAMSGNERWAAERLEATATWRLWAKGVGAVSAADRVVIGGRPYQIRFADNVEKRGKWYVLDLHEGAAT